MVRRGGERVSHVSAAYGSTVNPITPANVSSVRAVAGAEEGQTLPLNSDTLTVGALGGAAGLGGLGLYLAARAHRKDVAVNNASPKPIPEAEFAQTVHA